MRELAQRLQSGILSVCKCLLVIGCLLWKPLNWFTLKIGWLGSLWCGVICWEVRRVNWENFAWFLGGDIFDGSTVSADFWANLPWICSDDAFKREFSSQGVESGLCILRGEICKQIVLFFFAIFKVTFSQWRLLNVEIN